MAELDCDELALADAAGARAFRVDREPPEFSRDQPYDRALSPGELRRFDVAAPVLRTGGRSSGPATGSPRWGAGSR